nr:HKT2 [Hordeum vulgare]WUG45407.1 HKT2 [Hordeum vulgare subsp. vulgare]
MPIRLHTFLSSARHVSNSSVFIFQFIPFHLNPLLVHLSYFVIIDVLGFVALMALKPSNPNYSPRYVDIFFLSTSAVTVTGLATIKMEDLSSSQVVILTLLMLLGSEMFVSLIGHIHELRKQNKHDPEDSRVRSVTVQDESQIEEAIPAPQSISTTSLKKSCLKYIGFVLLAYMVLILLVGSLSVFLYVAHVSTARDVLTRKSINTMLFSISVTVSSFTNGGLIPTNESMAVFSSNQGLLLLLTGQILAGNTLLPVFLRLVMWALRGLRIGRAKPEEFKFMMNNTKAVGFNHLLPNQQTVFLAASVAALIAVTVTFFCCLNWDSPVFAGLTANQKITNALVHGGEHKQAGENSIDAPLVALQLSISITMWCIPASTSFISLHEGDERGITEHKDRANKRRLSLNKMLFSPLACSAALIMLVCITERRSLSADPLNFSTFNMIFEAISAHRNVGLSMGYSCARLPHAEKESGCQDMPYSFSGWWSDQGKVVLVLVMLCGRLQCFHRHRS